MLDLGITPSQVSLQASANEARNYFDETDGDYGKSSQAFCISLQSLGLGGNRITCLGAGYLADGLKTNTSKAQDIYIILLLYIHITYIHKKSYKYCAIV